MSLADPKELLEKINAINKVGLYTRSKLGTKDVEYCIRFAQLLPKEIVY
jgi:hypothetical protein